MKIHEKIAIWLAVIFAGIAMLEGAERPQDDARPVVRQETQVRTHRMPESATEAPKPAPVEPVDPCDISHCISYPIDGPAGPGLTHMNNPDQAYKAINEGIAAGVGKQSDAERIAELEAALEDAEQQAEDGD